MNSNYGNVENCSSKVRTVQSGFTTTVGALMPNFPVQCEFRDVSRSCFFQGGR